MTHKFKTDEQPTVNSIRKQIRSDIFQCIFYSTGLKIERRMEEYKHAYITAQNFIMLGYNTGLFCKEEAEDWLKVLQEDPEKLLPRITDKWEDQHYDVNSPSKETKTIEPVAVILDSLGYPIQHQKTPLKEETVFLLMAGDEVKANKNTPKLAKVLDLLKSMTPLEGA